MASFRRRDFQEDAGHRPAPTRLLQYAEPSASLHLRRSLDPRVRVGGGRKIDAPGKLPGDLLGNRHSRERGYQRSGISWEGRFRAALVDSDCYLVRAGMVRLGSAARRKRQAQGRPPSLRK